jgi:outer membrane receptor protein involved in Fe transport
MVKKILFSSLIFMLGMTASFGQTSLEGTVTDKETGEPILFGTVAIYKGTLLVTGTETDLDGNYILSALDPGTYDIEVSYVGYTTQRLNSVVVQSGRVNRVNFEISQEGVLLDLDVEIKEFRAPLIEQDNTTSGATVTSEKIKNLPSKSVNAIASTTAGLSSVDEGAISIRGSRTDATAYYVDGIRVLGLVPQSEIDQMQVITGGMSAKYGDVTGGLISITTKGPSSQFSGGFEAETSQYLDPYGYNLLSGYLSGPIIKKNGVSLLGFRLSGQYRYQYDDNPSAVGVYRLSEERINEIELEPTTLFGGSIIPTATFLTNEDVGGVLDARPNEDSWSVDVTGKLDAKLSKNIDVSFSGSYVQGQNRFTPGGWALLNWNHNPYNYSNRYRANFRFRHRLGSQGVSSGLSDEEKARRSSSVIRNAFYTVQVGYEKAWSNTEDFIHQDNLFNYGYFGNVDRTWEEAIEIVDINTWKGPGAYQLPTGQWVDFVGYREVYNGFTPSETINPVLARYNDINGQLYSDRSVVWDDLYNNVGQVYNSFAKSESHVYSFNFAVGLDFLPGGSKAGRHNIELGLTYEQRENRYWNIAPRALWQVARLYANDRHITGVDTTDVIGMIDTTFFGQPISFMRYNTLVNEDADLKFYKAVREMTGDDIHDYVNVDGIDPNDLRLDMFSATELNNNNLLYYYGYDYLGNKTTTATTFNDFFGEGRKTFPVSPNVPIYGAAYIQDKFSYKDIIFRLGLRVDYYDANTSVLKDPYALYESETARDFYDRTGLEQPSSVSDDYKVYVDGEESNGVVGFRTGDQWFLPNGTSTEGNILFAGKLVYPSYKGRFDENKVLNIKDPDFDPNTSFEDYTPQFNYMPRVAFSFPISDEAGFFAHYDITVQRPQSSTVATARDYFYFEDNVIDIFGNPALKPERTVDYEVGFQQKLTNSSALKISSYYKELRDMIQSRIYPHIPAPINSYEGYDNIDFGTVKGFSFTYDYRRTGNLEFQVAYTLQFANGTGSNANSSRGINSRGNLRYLIPLSYDERHRISGVLDYRYAGGKRYNGPTIAGVPILENTGINMLVTAVSGRPYTRTFNPTPFGGSGFLGSINGARLPWYFNIDMRIDRDINIKNKAFVNVYFRAQNILNIKNVLGVYSVTGSAEDSGYLVSSYGQDRINDIEGTGRPVDSFLDMYSWRLLAPGFYSSPRRMYIGAVISF